MDAVAEATPPEVARHRRERVDPYLVVGAVMVLFTAAVSLRHPWVGDFGVHAATLERLKVNFWHPGNPLVESDGPSVYFTPYTVLLGAVARLTGWPGRTVLEVVAPLNMALFLYGLRRFVALFSRARWAPVLALAASLTLWGTTHLAWSGFVSLFGLPLITPYPSFVAFGAMLLWWAWFATTLDGPFRPWRYAGLAVSAAAIALTHPFTAIIAGLGAVALLAGPARARAISRSHWLGLAGAVAGTGLLLVVWPYYSFFALAGAGGFDDIHEVLYVRTGQYFGLAALTLPALLLRLRRNRRDPLVLLFLLALIVVGLGPVTGRFALARVFPGVLIAGQVAFGVELAGAMARRAWWRRPVSRVAVPLALAALAFGFVAQAGNLLLALPASRGGHLRSALHTTSSGPGFEWVARKADAGDIVLTDDVRAQHALPGYGLRTVVSGWPDPFLDDAAQRQADQRAILDPATPEATRAALLRRYHVGWILVPAASASGVDGWTGPDQAELAATGPRGDRLYRLPLP